MTIRYRIDRERGIAFVEAEGVLDDAALLDFAQRASSDPEYTSGIHELVDFRRAELGALTTPAIRKAAETFLAGARSPQVKVALVVDSDAGYGLSRMYQAFRGDGPGAPQVFRSLAEARAWLGLGDEPA